MITFLAVLAAIGWTGFLLELLRGGRFRRARIVRAKTTEAGTHRQIRKIEQSAVDKLTDDLTREARSSSRTFTRAELQAEARRLLRGGEER